MTKVDERSVVPPVDEAARARLARALDLDGVVAVRLMGSQATGRAGPLSDVDLGVWLDRALTPERRHQLRLELLSAAVGATRTAEVDLVLLDDAPPLLAHRALADGVLLLVRDERERVRRETRALLDYLDTQPLRDGQAAAMRRRIAEGRFGRR